MSNFEKVAASPETLGAFLASLPIADGPWDGQFHRQSCDGCKQTCNHCQYKDKRNNPTWWLKLGCAQGTRAAPCGDTERQAVGFSGFAEVFSAEIAKSLGLNACGRDSAHTEKELAEAVVDAAFSQFAPSANRGSSEASHA